MFQGSRQCSVWCLLKLLVLQLNVTTVTSLRCAKHCSATATLYSDTARHCYYYFQAQVVWVNARDKCEAENTNLLHLETPAEQAWFMNVMKGIKVTHSPLWLGMTPSTDWYWYWHYKKSDRPLTTPQWSPSVAGVHPASVLLKRHGKWQITGPPPLATEFVCEDPNPSEVLWSRFCHWDLPNATVLYCPKTRRCYYILQTMTWGSARSTCEMAGTNLLHLETPDEQNWLGAELKARAWLADLWLGLEMGSSGIWSWIHGSLGLPMTPRTWAGYEVTGPTHARLTTTGSIVQTVETETHLAVCEGDVFKGKEWKVVGSTIAELLSQYVCDTFNNTVRVVFDSGSLHCYYIQGDKGTLDEASNHCAIRDSYPVQLETEHEQNMLYNEVYPKLLSFEVWMATRHDGIEWVWLGRDVSNSTPVVDPRWVKLLATPYYTDPDVTLDAVVAAANGRWFLDSSSSSHDVVCEDDWTLEDVTHLLCWTFPEAIAFLCLERRTCYYLFPESHDWSTAHATCKTGHNTHVLNVETLDEQTWIETQLSYLGELTSVWLGLHRTSFDQWSWTYSAYSERTSERRFATYDDVGPGRACTQPTGTWSQRESTDSCGLVCEQPITLEMLQDGIYSNEKPSKINKHKHKPSHPPTPTPTPTHVSPPAQSTKPQSPPSAAPASSPSSSPSSSSSSSTKSLPTQASTTSPSIISLTSTTTSSSSSETTPSPNLPHSVLPCPLHDTRPLDSVFDMKFKREGFFIPGLQLTVLGDTGKLACGRACARSTDCDWFLLGSAERCTLMTFSFDATTPLRDCGQDASCYWKECKLENLLTSYVVAAG